MSLNTDSLPPPSPSHFQPSSPRHSSSLQHLQPSSSTSWRSVFKLGNGSSKKLSTLSLDTNGLAPSPSQSFSAQSNGLASLSPTPVTPGGNSSANRYSFNSSSNTESSDSLSVSSTRMYGDVVQPPSQRSFSHTQSIPELQDLSASPSSRSKEVGRSESSGKRRWGGFQSSKSAVSVRDTGHKPSSKQAVNGTLSPQKPQPSISPKSSFSPPSSPPSRQPTTPSGQRRQSGMGHWIRRVASAPNAKGLFSAHTKNGMLAPPSDHEAVPPLPGSSLEGQDSLETVSSSSSRGKPKRKTPVGSPIQASNGLSFSFSRKEATTRVSNNNLEGPGKVAFRRTYSSQSIKVREVG
jgi:protein-serine/threonine kinase